MTNVIFIIIICNHQANLSPGHWGSFLQSIYHYFASAKIMVDGLQICPPMEILTYIYALTVWHFSSSHLYFLLSQIRGGFMTCFGPWNTEEMILFQLSTVLKWSCILLLALLPRDQVQASTLDDEGHVTLESLSPQLTNIITWSVLNHLPDDQDTWRRPDNTGNPWHRSAEPLIWPIRSQAILAHEVLNQHVWLKTHGSPTFFL